jgi:hypothetical protein
MTKCRCRISNVSIDVDISAATECAHLNATFHQDIAIFSPVVSPRVADDPVVAGFGIGSVTHSYNSVIRMAGWAVVIIEDTRSV